MSRINVHAIMASVCVLAILLGAALSNAEPKSNVKPEVWRCTQMELTDRVTLRSKGGDKKYYNAHGQEISKVDAIKQLLRIAE